MINTINTIAGGHMPGSKNFTICTPEIDSIGGKHHPIFLDSWNEFIKKIYKQDTGRTSPSIESIAAKIYTTVSNIDAPT
jgi:tRNA U54 and U55 pseudouridine synthase Pus10